MCVESAAGGLVGAGGSACGKCRWWASRSRRQVRGKCRWWASRSRRQVRVESAAGGLVGAGGRCVWKVPLVDKKQAADTR